MLSTHSFPVALTQMYLSIFCFLRSFPVQPHKCPSIPNNRDEHPVMIPPLQQYSYKSRFASTSLSTPHSIPFLQRGKLYFYPFCMVFLTKFPYVSFYPVLGGLLTIFLLTIFLLTIFLPPTIYFPSNHFPSTNHFPSNYWL